MYIYTTIACEIRIKQSSAIIKIAFGTVVVYGDHVQHLFIINVY